MLVPQHFPVEPGANRCGDTFQKTARASGELPAYPYRGFGDHLVFKIEPVTFHEPGGPFITEPSQIPALGQNSHQYAEFRDAINSRIDSALVQVDLYDNMPQVAKNKRSLRWLLEHAQAEMDAAQWAFDSYDPPQPPGPGEPIVYPSSVGTTVANRMRDALRHLRCAQYWTARLRLFQEALDEYEPLPQTASWFTAAPPPAPKPLGFRQATEWPELPPPDDLPPPQDVPTGLGGEGPSPEQRWKVAAALAGAAALFFVLPKMMR